MQHTSGLRSRASSQTWRPWGLISTFTPCCTTSCGQQAAQRPSHNCQAFGALLKFLDVGPPLVSIIRLLDNSCRSASTSSCQNPCLQSGSNSSGSGQPWPWSFQSGLEPQSAVPDLVVQHASCLAEAHISRVPFNQASTVSDAGTSAWFVVAQTYGNWLCELDTSSAPGLDSAVAQ